MVRLQISSCVRKLCVLVHTFVILTITAGYLTAQHNAAGSHRVSSLKYEGEVETSPWQRRAVARGARVVSFVENQTAAPIVFVTDPSGRRDRITITIPDSNHISIDNVDVSSKGEVAVVGGALSSDSRPATFVARISSDGSRQTLTRVFPYMPKAVTFAPDDTIWVLGNLMDETAKLDVAFHVLRRYDRSGKMLSSQAIYLRGDHGGEEVGFFCSSNDRVGFYTKDGEYVEWSLSGSEIGRYVGPDGLLSRTDTTVWPNTTMALSEANDVIVARILKENPELLILDREKREWVRLNVDGQMPKYIRLLGFDGSALVAATGNSRIFRFRAD